MILLVNDTNILIDLLKTDMIEQFFGLNYEFHVTDFAANEIHETNVIKLDAFIKEGRLIKWSFEFKELMEIQSLEMKYKKLSITDCSCLFLANRLSATLLTGDAVLRGVAQKKCIPVHGTLWVFDELVKNRLMSHTKACKKLNHLMEVNPRLPMDECNKRIAKWNKGS